MDCQRRSNFIDKTYSRKSHLAIVVAASLPKRQKHVHKRFSIITLILVMVFPFLRVRHGTAQSNVFSIQQIRTMKANKLGLVNPVGLTFSKRDTVSRVGWFCSYSKCSSESNKLDF
jgi:hypothetical protein